jgi:hypothetical protein
MKYSIDVQDRAKDIVYNLEPDDRDFLLWLHICSILHGDEDEYATPPQYSLLVKDMAYEDN